MMAQIKILLSCPMLLLPWAFLGHVWNEEGAHYWKIYFRFSCNLTGVFKLYDFFYTMHTLSHIRTDSKLVCALMHRHQMINSELSIKFHVLDRLWNYWLESKYDGH